MTVTFAYIPIRFLFGIELIGIDHAEMAMNQYLNLPCPNIMALFQFLPSFEEVYCTLAEKTIPECVLKLLLHLYNLYTGIA